MTTRHMYRKDFEREGMCECGQGRSQDVHQMLIWRKAPSGSWVADISSGVAYRIRGRRGQASWWPEYADLAELRASGNDEGWTRIGSDVGIRLSKAKDACERHRESRGH